MTPVIYTQEIAKQLKDRAFRARIKNNPALLYELQNPNLYGKVELIIVEDSEDAMNFIIPANNLDVSDEHLTGIRAGGNLACASSASTIGCESTFSTTCTIMISSAGGATAVTSLSTLGCICTVSSAGSASTLKPKPIRMNYDN